MVSPRSDAPSDSDSSTAAVEFESGAHACTLWTVTLSCARRQYGCKRILALARGLRTALLRAPQLQQLTARWRRAAGSASISTLPSPGPRHAQALPSLGRADSAAAASHVGAQASDLDSLRQVRFLSSVMPSGEHKALTNGEEPASSGEPSSEESESDEVRSQPEWLPFLRDRRVALIWPV